MISLSLIPRSMFHAIARSACFFVGARGTGEASAKFCVRVIAPHVRFESASFVQGEVARREDVIKSQTLGDFARDETVSASRHAAIEFGQ